MKNGSSLIFQGSFSQRGVNLETSREGLIHPVSNLISIDLQTLQESRFILIIVDFVPGRAVIDAAHRKRVKYEAKCANIGYGFLHYSFSSLRELEKDVVTLLKRIRKFSVTQDIGALDAIHILNMIKFAIAKGVEAQLVSRLLTNFL
ncbi:hypothetical protein Tco_0760258 [Tanacetum coccineum]